MEKQAFVDDQADLVGQMLGSLFRVRFKLWGVGCKVWGPRIFGFRGLGLGLRVQGFGFRV